MDKINLKLLTELDANPRIPLSKLAKKIGVSQQVADYRLKNLIRDGLISKLSPIVNLTKIGLEHYRIFFTFNSKKEFSSKEIFDYLKIRKGVYWAARIGGKYDLVAVLFVKNFREFDEFIDEFNKKFSGLIKDYKSTYVINHEIYRHKYFSENKIGKLDYISYGYSDEKKELDSLDLHILKKLKENCRLSSLEISKGAGCTYKTIINRIRTLEKEKIILGYRMFIKSEAEKPFIILLSFKDYSLKKEDELIYYLRTKKEVTQALRLFGAWNMFIHLRGQSNENIQNFLIELRDKFCIIDDYEIIPVFEDISINLMP